MKNKKIVISLGVILVMLLGTGVTLYLTSQEQQTSSNAQVSQNSGNSSCQAPDAVNNVQITYPNCQGGAQCDFTSAICSWDAVTDASNYKYTITEVDSGTVVKNDSLAAPTVQVTFPVTEGKTYKCDVSAVNSCGAVGGTGSDTQLCQVAGVFGSPSPAPGITVTPIPTSPPALTPVPSQTILTCGQPSCGATVSCEPGLVCVQSSNGQSYCAQAAYANACTQNPSTASCCFAPAVPAQPQPTIPPTGSLDGTILIGGGTLILLVAGGILLLL